MMGRSYNGKKKIWQRHPPILTTEETKEKINANKTISGGTTSYGHKSNIPNPTATIALPAHRGPGARGSPPSLVSLSCEVDGVDDEPL